MSTASDLERYMLELINAERTSQGLSELVLEKNLNASAEDHTIWSLSTDSFSHTGKNGSTATQRMMDAGFDFDGSWASGENIAYQSVRGEPGFRDDVYDLHVSLMNSPGHRANILTPGFEVIGIGIEVADWGYNSGSDYTAIMVTQNFAATDGTLDLDLGGDTGGDTGGSGVTEGNDTWVGTQDTDQINTLGGDDRLTGQGGNDELNGRAGQDTAVYSGLSDDYAIVIQNGMVTVRQKGGPDGTDTLQNIEHLAFSDTTMTLYTGVTQLTESQLQTFVEMYIAYFDRAPLAEGLSYWGTRLTDGMSLGQIAKSFFAQPETQARYPDSMPLEQFVTEVFTNVLGRTPADEGRDYYVGEIEAGRIDKGAFMLAAINGAKAATGNPADAANLAAKADIGTYFAAIKGMMDWDASASVMALYDGTQASLNAAKAQIDTLYAATQGDDDAGLTIQILGVTDDPFA